MSTGPPALKSTRIPPPTPSAQRSAATQSTTASQDASSTQSNQQQSGGAASPDGPEQDDEVPGKSTPPPRSSSPANIPLLSQEIASSSAEIPGHAPACPSSMIPIEDICHADGDTGIGMNESDFFSYHSAGSFSDLESLLDNSAVLGWNDLFGSTTSLPMPVVHDETYNDSLEVLAYVASHPPGFNDGDQFLGHSFEPGPLLNEQSMGTFAAVTSPQPPPYAQTELDGAEVLEDAKVLLKHFRDVVISQFAPLPMHSKSPWEILNWSNAVHTLADITFLQSSNVKHANLANLFAIIGWSAHTITKTQNYPDVLSYQRGTQILDYASRHAKSHMQESLKSETAGPGKSKYKDQLMALFSLVALAVCIPPCCGHRAKCQ
ncbi:unnamed protein product [Alternaria alternata]